ncbi:MAG: DUF1801 domain-containing protein [Candidatus Lambdaproteobacteria bacterium]|nr:DUF1801 domain-containing protein [Candidatus Lambdaproteobacteria bacterium]
MAKTGSAGSAAQYFAGLPSPQREIAEALRRLVQETAPGLREAFKWHQPCYEGTGIVCYIRSHKAHVNLGFYQGALLPDPEGLLEGTGKGLRHVKVRSLDTLPVEGCRALLRAALAVDDAGG